MGTCMSFLKYTCDNETMCYDSIARQEKSCDSNKKYCSSLYIQPTYQLQKKLTEKIPEYYQRPALYNPAQADRII